MDLVVLIQLELLVVVVDVVGQVVPLAQEGVSAKGKGGLVMGNALLLPFVKKDETKNNYYKTAARKARTQIRNF